MRFFSSLGSVKNAIEVHPCHSAALWLALIAALLTASPAAAQQATAQVNGTVTDSSAAIVVGAHVTLRNSQTGITRDTTSNKDGIYLFTLVPIGNYELMVEQKSFKRFEQKGSLSTSTRTQRSTLHSAPERLQKWLRSAATRHKWTPHPRR